MPANYEDLVQLIIRQIKLIKELNDEACDTDLNEQSAIYIKGAGLDSKDVVELILRLDEQLKINLLDNVEFNIDIIKYVGTLAKTIQSVLKE
jgi:acyl carrier protein